MAHRQLLQDVVAGGQGCGVDAEDAVPDASPPGGAGKGLEPENEAVVAMEMQAGGGTTVAQVASHPLPQQTSTLSLIGHTPDTHASHTPDIHFTYPIHTSPLPVSHTAKALHTHFSPLTRTTCRVIHRANSHTSSLHCGVQTPDQRSPGCSSS